MASESPDDVNFDPMSESFLKEASIEEADPFKRNTFRPFFLFGERIPNLHRPGLYLHLVIVILQMFFNFNTQIIMDFTLNNITLEYNITKSLFKNDFSKPLLSSVPYLLIPFIVYFCDRQMVRRYYLVFSSIMMGFIASCILLILLLLKYYERESLGKLISGNENSSAFLDIKYFVDVLGYTFCALSSILFSFSQALSFPFSIVFGLDILHGTQYEILMLYFPLFYISRNLSATISYLLFVEIVSEYTFIHCMVTTIAITIALLLTVLGRWKGYFRDSAVVANNFSFRRGFIIFLGAFKRKFIYLNRTSFKSLMILRARMREYDNPRDLVKKTRAMIRINFIIIILIPLLGCNQILQQLFPQQAYFLYFIPIQSNTKYYYCNSNIYFIYYLFFDPLTIIFLGPFIEYFFYDIIFDNKRQDLPCWVNCISLRIRFIRVNYGSRLREKLRKHFTLVDPLLKRIFWGLPFGLLSAICALIVEVLRIMINFPLHCGDGSHSIGTTIPLIVQIPQLVLSGILESISMIGLLQYTYYLCSKHFQNSLKGFFFSLFYFYYGVAGFISNLFNFTLVEICAQHCGDYQDISVINTKNTANQWCLVDNTNCRTSFLPNGWAIWVIVIGLYLIMIPLFYFLSHKSHWKRVKGKKMFLRELKANAELSNSLIN